MYESRPFSLPRSASQVLTLDERILVRLVHLENFDQRAAAILLADTPLAMSQATLCRRVAGALGKLRELYEGEKLVLDIENFETFEQWLGLTRELPALEVGQRVEGRRAA